MVQAMARTPQPGFLSSWLASFGSFDAAHGWAVNLFAVVALAVIGALLVSGRRRFVLAGLIALVPFCLADWVLVEDLGFLGGVGTDPNSMLPMALLFIAGYVAMVRVPAETEVPAGSDAGVVGGSNWWERASLSYVARTIAAVAALAIVIVGTAPMAMAAVNQNADPILTEALDGSPNSLDIPAPHFALTDQRGNPVSLASLRGHTVALTFLDPVCTSDCPLIAQEFRQADQRLGDQGRQVDFVAIVANPIYRSASFTNAFDRQESLNGLPNWYYLTGSVPALQRVWNSLRNTREHRRRRGDGRPQRSGLRDRRPGSRARCAHRRPRADPDIRVIVLLSSPEPDRPSPQFVSSRTPGRRRPRPRGLRLADCRLRTAVRVARRRRLPDPGGAAVVRPPLESAVSTSSGSWVILPMGDLSDQDNTFWQLFHAPPGSSHWSLVTPPGVADNGRLVAGASVGSILVGVLPSRLLRFSPLSQSSDGGHLLGPDLPSLRAWPRFPTPSPIRPPHRAEPSP